MWAGAKRATRRGFVLRCIVVACIWCGEAVPAHAQTGAGEITGIVKGPGGDAVPGATITVTETRTNRQRLAVSMDDGVYTAPSLAPGEYRLDVELAGFTPVRREGVRLSTGEKARIDFELSVGNIREQVTVSGDAPVIREETASLGTVVENEQVVRLPLNGRLFIALAALAPGVALPPNSVLPRINELTGEGGGPLTVQLIQYASDSHPTPQVPAPGISVTSPNAFDFGFRKRGPQDDIGRNDERRLEVGSQRPGRHR